MTGKVVILVTAGTAEEARKIADHLAETKLAACVNISSPIESVYWWEGKVNHDQEYQLFIKSSQELFPEIRAAIAKLHSYQNPEIICLPIVAGAEAYLEWISDSVKPVAAKPGSETAQ